MQRRWAKVLAALALLSFMSLGAVGVAQAAKGEPMSEEDRFEKWCQKRQAQGKDCEKDDDNDGGEDARECGPLRAVADEVADACQQVVDALADGGGGTDPDPQAEVEKAVAGVQEALEGDGGGGTDPDPATEIANAVAALQEALEGDGSNPDPATEIANAVAAVEGALGGVGAP